MIRRSDVAVMRAFLDRRMAINCKLLCSDACCVNKSCPALSRHAQKPKVQQLEAKLNDPHSTLDDALDFILG